MQKYFAYVRVSTAKQGEHGVSLEEQRDAIRRYADRQGLDIKAWFEERQTAAKRGRAVFARMLKLLRNRRAAGVIIHKVDRSARNLKDWADLGELIDDRIEVHFAHDPVDLRSRAGRLSADIQAVVAADYIRNLREETRKGFYGRLKQGLYPRPAPIGYRDQGRGLPKTIDPVQGPIVRTAFTRYATGQVGLERLAEEMYTLGLRNRGGGRVSLHGLSGILNNPFYTGFIRIAKTGDAYKGQHEPIVPPAVFNAVKGILSGKTPRRPQKHRFVFRRLLSCAHCGYSLVGELKKGHIYYRCHTRTCPTTNLREEAVDDAVRAAWKPLAFVGPALEELVAEARAMQRDTASEARTQQAGLVMSRGRIDEKLKRLADGYLDNTIERAVFQERQKALLMERLDVEHRLRGVEADSGDEPDEALGAFLELAATASLAYERATDEDKRELVEILTSNRTVDCRTLTFSLSEPFNRVAECFQTNHGSPQRCPLRTRELLGNLKSMARSQEFAQLFRKIREFLHPVDHDDGWPADRERTFPFRNRSRPANQAA